MNAVGSMPPWPHTGAILAGGFSSRMGGMPKHALPMGDGRSMIEHVAAPVRAICARLVVLAPEPLPELHGVPHVADRHPGLGPLGGIEALLASGEDDQYLVVPCDMPHLTPQLLAMLLAPSERLVSALRVRGVRHSLPLRISRGLLPLVERQHHAGRLGLHELLDVANAAVIDVPPDWEAALVNINAPEEYARLQRRMT